MTEHGFIKLVRSQDAYELMTTKPKAFALLALIAYRAKRTKEFSVYRLKVGEALIGDLKPGAFTEKEYRVAKEQLEKWRFAAFRGTSKGTVAMLLDKRIFDIHPEAQGAHWGDLWASKGRTKGEQGATNKNDKKKKNEKMKERKVRRTYVELRNKLLKKRSM